MIDEADKLSYALWSMENSPDGIFWTDPGGNILYVNRALCTEIGYSEDEFLNLSVLDLDPMVRSQDLGMEGRLAVPVRSGDIAHLSSLYRHKDGHLIPVDVTMSVPRDDGLLIVCFIRDTSEEKETEKKLGETERRFALERNRLMREASTDFLTGTWLRRYFFEVAGYSMQQADLGESPLSILMIDVDRFKEVNDALGHDAGDAVLVEFCRIVSGAIREDDYFVRWGGDEFILLMPGLDGDGAVNMGKRIAELVAEHCFAGTRSLTVSIGAAEYRPGKDDIESWLGEADAALYRAKEAGRNRVEK